MLYALLIRQDVSDVSHNSTYLVNVSMNTMINLKVITSGSGPIVSMEICCIGRKVETTNREALMIWFHLDIFRRDILYVSVHHAVNVANSL